MSWTKKSNIILLVLSCVVGLIVFEVAFFFLNKNQAQIYQWNRRYMLFKAESQTSVFRNVNNIFVYQPNQKIESTTFYYVNNEWIKEYDYIFPTNNLGLVQTAPTFSNKDSLLLLGDSFTEGHGAYPWFEEFREKLNTELQLINGGILGTGFQSWKLLHDHLIEKDIKVKKLVIVFISDDYIRGVRNIPTKVFACIQNTDLCMGDEDFYGKPEGNKLPELLEKLRAYRERRLEVEDRSTFKAFLTNLLPGVATIYRFLNGSFPFEISQKSFSIIEELVAQYGSDVLFVRIPQKDEVELGRISRHGKEVVDKIKSVNGIFFDGNSECKFEKSDYFINDGHPNEKGYEKISQCVMDAIKLKWGYLLSCPVHFLPTNVMEQTAFMKSYKS
jgi:hypothetical protein